MTESDKPLSHTEARALIDAHFSLHISPPHERRLRTHLTDCAECATYYERHLLVSALDPAAPTREQRIAAGLGLPRATRKANRASFSLLWTGTPASTVASLCATVLVVGLGIGLVRANEDGPSALTLTSDEKTSESDVRPNLTRAMPTSSAGMTARGGQSRSPTSQVFGYRIEDGERAERIGTNIEASDELAFAYVNPGGFQRLLIFGVDEHGHVYWYQPTWTSAADDPHAVPVESGPEVHELLDSVAHTFDGKQLTIHYIFTNEDISVREVERRLKGQRNSLHTGGDTPSGDESKAPLGLRNSVQGSVNVHVDRVE